MFKVEDFNPIYKPPQTLISSNTNGNVLNSSTTGNANAWNNSLNISNLNNLNNLHTPLSNHYSNIQSNQNQNSFPDEKSFSFTNYYKFCSLSNINCYFYQFNNSLNNSNNNSSSGNNSGYNSNVNNGNNNNNGSNNSSANGGTNGSNSQNSSNSTYEILKYEQLIRQKLKNDYQINDIITWIAKRELCLFQLQVEDSNANLDSNIGFNQLKDAMNNIISENNLSLKLISASTLDANKIFGNSNLNQQTALIQKKTLNVVYLSFLRAVHKFVIQKLISNHSLFEASNQSLSIEILPFSGQLIASSMIQKSIITVESSTKKKKILKKLVPYSILKVNPSLNQKNELVINMTSLKKIFYKLTDYITISCNNSIDELNKKSRFALYIAPSGIRCLIAGNNYSDSITDEPPENHEKLFNILKNFNDIDLVQNPTLINGKRLWIKIHPSTFNLSSLSPSIANYINCKITTGKKFLYWPLELCFVQFPTDLGPGVELEHDDGDDNDNNDNDEYYQSNDLLIDDPLDIVNDFIDLDSDTKNKNDLIADDILTAKIDPTLSPNTENNEKNDFKLPMTFDFKHGIDSIDRNFKPEKENQELLDNIMQTDNDFDDLFNAKHTEDNINLNLINDVKQANDNEFEQKLKEVFESEDQMAKHDDIKIDSNFDNDWDDLFGDTNESADENDETGQIISEDTDTKSMKEATLENENNSNDMDINVDDEVENAINDAFGKEWNSENFSKDDNDIKQEQPNPTFNSEVIESSISPIESVKSLVEQQPLLTSPLYQDPGAPYPIPFQIFAPEDETKSENPIASGDDKNPSKSLSLTPKDIKKSIFSPLAFNPLIEKDIDSKYSNGGKFFVKNSSKLSKTNDFNNVGEPTDETRLSSTASVNLTPTFVPENRCFQNMTTPLFNLHGTGKTQKNNILVDNLISDSEDDSDFDNFNMNPKLNGSSFNDDAQKSDFNEEDVMELGDEDNENEDNEYNDDNDGEEDNKYKNLTSTGLGIFSTENPTIKRRKLGTMYDNNLDDDDDELDLNFEDEQFENDEEIKSDTNIRSSEEIADIPKIEISESKIKDSNDINNINIEIPNSWFYVLRPVSPIQVPFNFLNESKAKIDKTKINGLLPILQEFVLFSQKYMNNQMLNMVVQNRECPSVLDSDMEYLLYKIFPGISKVQCYELLDSEKENRSRSPFECLFGNHPPKTTLLNNAVNLSSSGVLTKSSLQEQEMKLFNENNYGTTSPNIMQQSSDMLHPTFSNEILEDFQKYDIKSVPSNNLFRINPTVLNMKRENEDVVVNSVGINFWSQLNLQPPNGTKDFEIIFVIPKAKTIDFSFRIISFIDKLIQLYKLFKLGNINKLNENGIVEIECNEGTKKSYWSNAQSTLLSLVDGFQTKFTLDEKKVLLVLFIDPFQDLDSLIRMADVASAFESALSEKHVFETEVTKKKKKKKNKIIAKLPITLFYKAFSIDSFYLRDSRQYVIFTNERYFNLSIELYNNCPNNENLNELNLKDRSNTFNIASDIQDNVKFMLTKKSVSKSLIEDDIYLHVCYERSVDKKWCVASWVDQTGRLNFTKSWNIGEKVEGSQSFSAVADDIMNITMDYVSSVSKKCYVILTRLNNIIPDDELAEWKRLSIKNNDLMLIVMTAELESSTLILSNNPGPIVSNKHKSDIPRDANYTVASTNSQSQTPGNILLNTNTYTHLVSGSAKFESPDVSMYTPSYEIGLSPLDVNNHQVPLHTLQSLPEEIINDKSDQPDTKSNKILFDISDECYGVILQIAQPLSNQPRVPLKTGFLVNTGEGITKNMVLEINLLSCQSGMNTNEFLKKLLVQYKHLGSLALSLGMTGIVRKCGNVDYDETSEDDDDDEMIGGWDDENIRKEKYIIQKLYSQFHKMQQKQKRQRIKEREKDFGDNDIKYNIIPIHILTVRKMLDFLVNIRVE